MGHLSDFWCTVHLIMMEKSALAGEEGGGGASPPPYQPITITYKVAVYATAEWADTVHSLIKRIPEAES
jgi:hypothetical protein